MRSIAGVWVLGHIGLIITESNTVNESFLKRIVAGKLILYDDRESFYRVVGKAEL